MSFVQASTLTASTGGATNSPSLAGVTSGNIVVLTIAWGQITNGNPPTVSGWICAVDQPGQTFAGGVGFLGVSIFYKRSSGGTENPTVTPAAGSSLATMSCQIQEHSNITILGPTTWATTVATSGNTGTTASTISSNATVVACVGMAENSAGTATSSEGISTPATAGYSSAGVQQDNTSSGTLCEFSYKQVTSTGTQTGSWTWTNTNRAVGAIAVFYESTNQSISWIKA